MVSTPELFARQGILGFEIPATPDLEHRLLRIRSPRYVDYEAGSLILRRFAWLYEHPEVPRPPCNLIYADTNNGKTALARKFIRDVTPQEGDPQYGKLPVVYCHSPPYADLVGLYDSILRALDAPYRTSTRAQGKWDQILHLLPAVGTRMLVVDEVNNLLVGKPDSRIMVLNSLKSLSNELRIPVVAMGTQDAVRVFQTSPELGNRFEPIGIPRWTISAEYGLFVSRFVKSLELREESSFRSKDLVSRIHRMAEGLTGETCKLMSIAAEVAIQTGREVIDMETLDKVPWVMPSERRRAAR
ncbi:AAA family ATPase [Aerophototrophica crusticola]|uniref:AAA family ATPase n=1 Tax=Aerophototrophica crusticola TaxID=1709002 RepID=A0A858R586_9PROT|nr:AAA family ATPase [Rhodospirillaceae bacterium B3]